MTEIRVIDVINKIAKGEEIPDFKYRNRNLTWNNKYKWFDDIEDKIYCKTGFEMNELNEEVKVIEKVKKLKNK